MVRDGKGGRDRVIVLPESVKAPMQRRSRTRSVIMTVVSEE